MPHELALKKVEWSDNPKASSHSPYLSALLQICAVWPCLRFKSLQANISWEEKQMVQLNTKILHHGMPCQISQTFPGWLNGEGWSEQALFCLNAVRGVRWRTISKATNSFLKAEDLGVLENQDRRAQNAHTEPHRVSKRQLERSRARYQEAEKHLPPRAHPCPQGWAAWGALSLGLSACTARTCPMALIWELR